MNSKTDDNNINQRKQKGGVFSFIGNIFFVLISSLFLSLLFEWIGIAFFWPEERELHSYSIMQKELGYLAMDFTNSLLVSEPIIISESILKIIHKWCFIDTGITDWMSNAKRDPSAHWSYSIYVYLSAYIESSVYIFFIFIIRLIILILTSPLFILTALVGFVDGLVRRDLRKFGCGYESSFVYHHSKRTIKPIFIFTWLLYLSIPFSIHPNFVLVPSALFFGIAITLTSGSFKKYL